MVEHENKKNPFYCPYCKSICKSNTRMIEKCCGCKARERYFNEQLIKQNALPQENLVSKYVEYLNNGEFEKATTLWGENPSISELVHKVADDLNKLPPYIKDFHKYVVNNTNSNKPPIGIKPKFIWQQERFYDLCGAISRYYDAGLPIKVEWIEEYNELLEVIEK